MDYIKYIVAIIFSWIITSGECATVQEKINKFYFQTKLCLSRNFVQKFCQNRKKFNKFLDNISGHAQFFSEIKCFFFEQGQFCSEIKLVYFFLKRRAFSRGDNSQKYYRCDIFYIIHVHVSSVTGARARISRPQFCSEIKFVYFFLKRRAFPRGDHFWKNYNCSNFSIIPLWTWKSYLFSSFSGIWQPLYSCLKYVYFFLKRRAFPRGDHFRKNSNYSTFWIIPLWIWKSIFFNKIANFTDIFVKIGM